MAATASSMAKLAGTIPRALTICAIGSSQSAHVVSRLAGSVERGHRVFLICEQRTGLQGITEVVLAEQPSDEIGVIVRLANSACRLLTGRSLGPIRRYLQLVQAMKAIQPDILHVHYAYSEAAWLAAATAFRPLVVSVMGGDVLFEEQGNPTPRGRRLTVQLLESADLITSKADYLTAELNRLGDFGPKTIKVVWGVRLERFRRLDASGLRTHLGIAPNAPVILSPKALQPFYNVDRIIEAMPRVSKGFPAARLIVTEYAPDPGYKVRIVERVKALGLEESVLFVGWIPHEEMPAYYSLADVAVAVPLSDGLPQALLEGMACGVPNILSRLPCYEEIVRHEQSVLFVDADSESIAAGISRLLGDTALRGRISHNARRIVEREADFDREVERVERSYVTLLAHPPQQVPLLRRIRILMTVAAWALAGG